MPIKSHRVGVARLSPRQLSILKLIAEGLTTKEIASRLEISAKTVETHRATIGSRLQIQGIANLTRFAVENKLVAAS